MNPAVQRQTYAAPCTIKRARDLERAAFVLVELRTCADVCARCDDTGFVCIGGTQRTMRGDVISSLKSRSVG